MIELEEKYNIQLNKIQQDLQASDDLAKYLDEEEEEFYLNLRSTFEPQIQEIYEEIAKANPLQLVPFEKALLAEGLEGMFLPKILGFSVLRGEIGSNAKYLRPQDHFRDILIAICNSSNFDLIKKRIGQTIQVGFALSSDIWITSLIDEFNNKSIKSFLSSQKLPKFRDPRERFIGVKLYNRQFKNDNFHSAEFPENVTMLKILGNSLNSFLEYRVASKLNNESIKPFLKSFLNNKDFFGIQEHTKILNLYISFLELDEKETKEAAVILNEARQKDEFPAQWISSTLEFQDKKLVTVESDAKISAALPIAEDDLTPYYSLMDTVHGKGFLHEDAVEAVSNFYPNYEGLSDINQAVRNTVLNYITKIIDNLTVEEYTELFELAKIFPVYIGIFSNQQFNQDIKESCLAYIKKLQKRYTDKRGRDYQDIKKFVKTTFVELDFMTEKKIVELFKTKRKKKVVAES